MTKSRPSCFSPSFGLTAILSRVFLTCVLATAAVHGERRARAADPAAPADSEVIAKIGNIEFKAEDIRALLAGLEPREQMALARDPAKLTQYIRTVLVRRLVLQEAEAKHWEQEPAVIAQIARAKDNVVVESYLESVSKVPASYPTDAEVQAAYDANKAALFMPKQFRLAQIYIAGAKGADKAVLEKAQAKLEAVRKSLKQKGADFAAIAKAQSDEPESAARGGELGWLTETRIQPEIRSQVTGLAKGAISEPIRLNDGWHILEVLDTKDAYTPPLEEVRTQLVQELRAERLKANSQAYLSGLLQRNSPSINELALPSLLPK